MNTLWTGTDAVVNDINAATPIAVTGDSAQQGPFDQVMQIGGRCPVSSPTTTARSREHV